MSFFADDIKEFLVKSPNDRVLLLSDIFLYDVGVILMSWNSKLVKLQLIRCQEKQVMFDSYELCSSKVTGTEGDPEAFIDAELHCQHHVHYIFSHSFTLLGFIRTVSFLFPGLFIGVSFYPIYN
jgi:hypothetical protein